MSVDTIRTLGIVARDLDAAVPALETAERERVRCERAYKVAQAKAYLDADGPVTAREAIAVLACADEWEAAQVAEAVVRVQREHIRALHARLDVGRTIAAAERAVAGIAP